MPRNKSHLFIFYLVMHSSIYLFIWCLKIFAFICEYLLNISIVISICSE